MADELELNLEGGVISPTGQFYPYGYAFTGDYRLVYRDSDEDIYFYLGSSYILIPKTHDDNYSELYYLNNTFYTFQQLHDLGYTYTQSEIVEIFDEDLIGRHLWTDIQWLYFSTYSSEPVNLPVMCTGSSSKAYVKIHNNDRNLFVEAKQAGSLGNGLSIGISYSDTNHKFYVYVYLNDSIVYDSGAVSGDTSALVNDYVTFSGILPAVSVSGIHKWQLSGGTDADTLGIPIYYDNYSQVALHDFQNYKITSLLIKKVVTSYDASSGNYIQDLSFSEEDINNFGFAKNGDNLYLVYTGGNPIENIIGFSFSWNYTGSLIQSINAIGITNHVPNGTTKLYSRYWWVYEFLNIYITNWYNPNYYSDGQMITQSELQPVGGTVYKEVYLTENSTNRIIPNTFQLATYNNKPDCLFDYSSTVSNKYKTGILVLFDSSVVADPHYELPSTLYTIDGTSVTWNVEHPLYYLFRNKEFFVV